MYFPAWHGPDDISIRWAMFILTYTIHSVYVYLEDTDVWQEKELFSYSLIHA